MANVIRFKRRAFGGLAGAPSSLATGEGAYNEQDDTFYVGFGDDGSGNATSIRAFAGAGTFATKAYLASQLGAFGAGDMSKAVYDPTNINASAFNVDNHLDGTTHKKYPAADKTKLAGIAASATANQTDAYLLSADNHTDGTTNKVLTATERTKVSGIATGATANDTDANLKNRDNHTDGTTYKGYSATEKGKLAAIEASADVTDAANVGSSIAGASAKTTPVNADRIAALDSAAGNALVYFTYQNLASAIVGLVTDTAPGTLDTLNELAAALGDDPNFATTISAAIALKANITSPTFLGTPLAPTAAAANDTTQIATTAHVKLAIAAATLDGGTF